MSQQKEDIHCLALDGGGIRGILELVYLCELEKRTNKKVHEIFHTVAGTSTGGLISLLLTVPGKNGKVASASEALEIYKTLASQIFYSDRFFSLKFLLMYFLLSLVLSIAIPLIDKPELIFPFANLIYGTLIVTCLFSFAKICHYISKPTYCPKGLEGFCENYFGETITLKDAMTNVGIVAVDIEKERPFVFNSMRAKLDSKCILHNAPISRIARSTSAAPSYFPPVKYHIKHKKEKIYQRPKTMNSMWDSKYQGKKETECPTSKFMTPWWDPRPVCSTYNREVIIFEDGGTKANNPSALCLDLAKWKLTSEGHDPESYNIRLLSLGTGEINGGSKQVKRLNSNMWYNPALPDGGLDHVLYRLLGNDVFNVTINSENVHVDVSLLYMLAKKEHDYHRVQFEINEHHLNFMDDISKANISSLIDVANKAVKKHFGQTERFMNKMRLVEDCQPDQNDEMNSRKKTQDETVTNRKIKTL